jgi:hypothetical protein
MNSYNILIILGICAVFAGCTSGTTPDQGAETIQHEGTKGDSSQAYQKPGAAVRFDHNYDGLTGPGEVETILLNFAEAYDAGTLSITVDADSGLSYELGSPQVFDLQSTDMHELTVDLSAATGGRYYLRIFAEVLLPDGQVDRRVFGLALQVGIPGDKSISSDEKHDTDFRGGELILLPAEERRKD